MGFVSSWGNSAFSWNFGFLLLRGVAIFLLSVRGPLRAPAGIPCLGGFVQDLVEIFATPHPRKSLFSPWLSALPLRGSSPAERLRYRSGALLTPAGGLFSGIRMGFWEDFLQNLVEPSVVSPWKFSVFRGFPFSLRVGLSLMDVCVTPAEPCGP